MHTMESKEAAHTQPDRRLLLLEFVTHERWVFDSRYYPFIKGAADSLGYETLWLCYGSQIQTEKTGPTSIRQFMHLDEEEIAFLVGHLEELRPTHVVLSHPVSEEVLRHLKATDEQVQILCTSDHPSPGVESIMDYPRKVLDAMAMEPGSEAMLAMAQKGGTTWLHSRSDWLLTWLGAVPGLCDDFDAYIVDVVTPAYEATLANERAVEYKPHLLMMGGLACDHRKAVKANPIYEGVDLSDCEQDFGCSYCTWYRGPTSDLKGDIVDTAVSQLKRVVETAGEGGRYCGVIDLLDIRVLSRIDRFAEAMKEVPLPPAIFCFEPRIDRVLHVQKKLDKALTLLEEQGHSVYLFRMGLENLVEEENEFFNKELTLAQIDKGSVVLEELKQAHPESFDYDPTWGYITCSPWTTLEMFETQVERGIERSYDPLGVWLYTPLLFYKGAPIARLADKEGGILIDEFEDLSFLYEAAVNGVPFNSINAWRFKDERAGVAFALMVRFCAAALRGKYPDTIFEGDELYSRLLAEQEDGVDYDRPDLFAREALAVVKEAASLEDRLQNLLKSLDGYREVMAELPTLVTTVDSPGADGSGPDKRIVDRERHRADKTREVLEQLIERYKTRLPPVEVVDARAVVDEGTIALKVSIEGTPYELRLDRVDPDGRYFFCSEHFGVSYVQDTPLESPEHQKVVKGLVAMLEHAAAGGVTEILPGAVAG